MSEEKKYLDEGGLSRLVKNIDDNYAPKKHDHDDRYYTESEIDSKFAEITSGSVVVPEATHASTADTATTAGTATNAGYATEAGHAGSADTADKATHAATADSATNADYAEEAGHATSADTAGTATTAGHATTADRATTAGSADTATKATQDGNGRVISETYQTIADATSQHNALQSSINNKIVMYTWESGD